MSRPTFMQGALVGFALALCGSALFAALRLFVSPYAALHLLMPLLSGAYVLYLLWRTSARTGRFATFVIWMCGAAAVGVFVESLPLAFVVHALMLWLVRALYFYTSALPAMVDLGLGALAAAGAIFSAQQSGSPFLAVWTFFLVQALFVAIPESLGKAPSPSSVDDVMPFQRAPFQRARNAAETALRRLASSH